MSETRDLSIFPNGTTYPRDVPVNHGTSGQRTLRMEHEVDPKEALLAALGDLSHIRLFSAQVLLAIYERPQKTKGGLFLPDNIRREDIYQGKVGLVVAKGPAAFKDDDRTQFHGQDVQIGEWVGYRVQDGWSLQVNGPNGAVHCRMLEDVNIKAAFTHPDDIY